MIGSHRWRPPAVPLGDVHGPVAGGEGGPFGGGLVRDPDELGKDRSGNLPGESEPESEHSSAAGAAEADTDGDEVPTEGLCDPVPSGEQPSVVGAGDRPHAGANEGATDQLIQAGWHLDREWVERYEHSTVPASFAPSRAHARGCQ